MATRFETLKHSDH